MRKWVIAALAMAAIPAWGDAQFRARKMTARDVPAGKGACDIRLQVDGEVEVSLRGDIVSLRTLSGREARDDGSECTSPLPDRDVKGFSFEVKDSRSQVKLVEKPEARNGFAALVRINDTEAGYGRYRFRLTWTLPKNTFPPGPGAGADEGFVWNNATHFAGRGGGTSVLNGGSVDRLLDVSIDIDQGGHAIVAFRREHAGPEIFNGMLIGREGDRLKIDAATEDHRLRGTMSVTLDRSAVRAVEMDGTDGQDRISVRWDRNSQANKD